MVLSFSSKEDAIAFAEKNGNDKPHRVTETRAGTVAKSYFPH